MIGVVKMLRGISDDGEGSGEDDRGSSDDVDEVVQSFWD